MGIADWLNAQFALNTSDLPDQPILNSAGKSNNNLAPVQAAFFQNAVTGQDQLAPARCLHPKPDLGGFGDNPASRRLTLIRPTGAFSATTHSAIIAT